MRRLLLLCLALGSTLHAQTTDDYFLYKWDGTKFVKTYMKIFPSELGASVDLTTEVTGKLPIANGGTNADTAAAARSSLGLVIGSDVQAYNASTSLLGSSIDLTSEVTGILPPANMGTGTSISTKYLRGDGTWQAISGGGDALTTGTLAQFASTTSAQLLGLLSDANGTGKAIFSAGTLDIATGKTLTASNTLTLAGTDGSTLTIGSGGTLGSAAFLNVGASANNVVQLNGSGFLPARNGSLLTSLNASNISTGTLALANGGTGSTTAAAARTALGLAIGTDVQAYSASTSLLGASIDLTTEITGTLPVANGGTGSTTAAAARTALGLAIGTDVQAYSASTSLLGSSIDLSSEVTGSLPQASVTGLTTSDRAQFANVKIAHSTLTYGATTTIDFDGNGFESVTLTGVVTFASSNRAAGRSKTLRIIGDTVSRTLTWPSGWKWVGATAPTGLAANKVAILTVTFFGTTDSDAVAAYAVEP